MLTHAQEIQFRTFGFVLLRSFFTGPEVVRLREEFNRAATRASEIDPFDGTKMHYFNMLGPETPFYASLPEEPRFYEIAEQLFGERTFAFESNAYRYVGDTRWHYNDGSSNSHGYGIKFQFALQPVDANTGALRFIPGSHKNPFQDQLAATPPLGRAWYDTPEAWKQIDQVPAHLCEYGPGDVVAFDLRIFHATSGGSNDRHMSCVSYFHYPETREEMATMREIVPTYIDSKPMPSMPWNDGIREKWIENVERSPKRQSWIESFHEVDETPQSQTGMRLVFDEYGASAVVPLDA